MQIDYNKRIYGLDVFRAIAILIVVVGHGGGISGDLFNAIPEIPLPNGVELFFVLSGFLIGGIFIREIDKSGTFSISQLVHFWKRRWFRTLPNYYLVLIANAVLVYLGITHGNIDHFGIEFFFFFQNFATGFTDFFWESWSLSIEEWFYIFLPIIGFCFLKILPAKRALLLTILTLLGAPLFYRILIADIEYDHFWAGINISKVVLTRLDAIIYGVLAAFIKHYYAQSWKQYKYPLFIAGLIITYVNVFVEIQPNDFYFRTFYFSVTSFGMMLLLPLADQTTSFKVPALGKAITHISLISYSMYLIHMGIVAGIIEKNFMPNTTTGHAVMYLVYWGTTILLSTLIYRYFERPTTQLRERFSRKK